MSSNNTFLDRADIAQIARGNPKLRAGLESIINQTASNTAAVEANAGTTQGLANTTFISLSLDDATPDQRVLAVVSPVTLTDRGAKGEIVIGLSVVPLTKDSPEIDTPTLPGLVNAANDAAAATAGVPVNGVYRNGSALMIRVS